MSEFSNQPHVPSKSKIAPLEKKELKRSFDLLEEGWEITLQKKLVKLYVFNNFSEALKFLNEVGKASEEEGHHPDIELSWGKVTVTFWTREIEGLSEADFNLALKYDTLYTSMKDA